MNIHVAGLAHPARDLVRDVQGAVYAPRSLRAERDGVGERVGGGHGAVVAVGAEIDVDGFEVARARFEVGEGGFQQISERGQAAEHHGRVDEVEGGVFPRPGRFGRVVDLEEEVRRDGGGLDGAEVGPRDGGAGVGVGHLEGPDAGAGADIEDGGGGGEEGGEV